MYNPNLTKCQADLSRKMNDFLTEFQEYYLRLVVDLKQGPTFLDDLIRYYHNSEKGGVLVQALDGLNEERKTETTNPVN